MSQITVTGSRKAKSAIRSMRPRGSKRSMIVVDDLLDARAHVLDATRSKGPHHKAAQAAMVGRILLQHPVAHAAIDRFLENLRAKAPGHSADEVLAETFVPKDRGDVRMAAGDIEAERREVHRVGFAQSMIKGIRIGNELR